jgi:tetratricopeptide (TPR) repeat protein
MGYLVRGSANDNLRQPAAAREDYEAALRHDPDLLRAHLNLALLTERQGRHDEAVRLAEAGLAARNRDPLEWRDLGAQLLKWKRPERAIVAYERAIEFDPRNTDLLVKGLECCIAINNSGRMREYSRRIFEVDKHEINYTGRLAIAEALDGNYEKALELFNKTVQAQPDAALRYSNRAVCYVNMKRWKEAAADLRRAIELDRSLEADLADDLKSAEQKAGEQ